MSDAQNLGFGKFVPGFDFLQNLAKNATVPQLPHLASWIAPTLDTGEIEKRIADLKAVHFWLEQNAAALTATIQALEVQKMTLTALKGMNLRMEDMAEAFKFKIPDTMVPPVAGFGASAAKPEPAKPAARPATKTTERAKAPAASPADGAAGVNGAVPGLVDPMQWWGSLTQQFQQIAANALKDASKAPMDLAAGMARETAKTVETVAKAASAVQPATSAKPATTKSASSAKSATSGKSSSAAKSAAPRTAKSPARRAAKKTTR